MLRNHLKKLSVLLLMCWCFATLAAPAHTHDNHPDAAQTVDCVLCHAADSQKLALISSISICLLLALVAVVFSGFVKFVSFPAPRRYLARAPPAYSLLS